MEPVSYNDPTFNQLNQYVLPYNSSTPYEFIWSRYRNTDEFSSLKITQDVSNIQYFCGLDDTTQQAKCIAPDCSINFVQNICKNYYNNLLLLDKQQTHTGAKGRIQDVEMELNRQFVKCLDLGIAIGLEIVYLCVMLYYK